MNRIRLGVLVWADTYESNYDDDYEYDAVAGQRRPFFELDVVLLAWPAGLHLAVDLQFPEDSSFHLMKMRPTRR